MTSPRASTNGANPATKPPRISLVSWLAVGGTGPPPTLASFCLMASERKAAYREEQAYKEARKTASADFQDKWPVTGLTSKRERPPNRRELMRLYGPKNIACERTGEAKDVNRHDSDGTARNNGDGGGGGGAGNEGSN
ncbi:hypothetical protein F4680DRAFT_255568 [Xylaria scruposa]|nr:hypothetical protein F4680DRAFT_255568 [Xylaria scruposa]